MDTNTSGEELLTKTRKTYTITKQRERWTDDEHDRFLEALRLYGRAWQRIEEHIGTKTAVQIRSHAQKFFTKVEKEAEAKGIPVSEALDINIPPPRSKRKPNAPYPRKPGNNRESSSHVSSAKLVLPSSSSHCNQANTENGTTKTTNVDNIDIPEKNKDRDSVHNYPQFHPPGFTFCPLGDRFHGHSSSHLNLPATTTTSSATTTNSQQAFPACHSFDDYHSFLQISSTFSNLIMSTLLQNPAAHAAATLAASVWPYVNVGNSGDSSGQMSSPPSIASITAATVAAATAWWASVGLLPVCAPPTTCLPSPTVTVTVPIPDMNKMNSFKNAQEKQSMDLQDQNLGSKSPASSSDGSEETGITKLNGDREEVVAAAAAHDSNSTQKKKTVDRSSCGSNTPSGSDAETDALNNLEKDKEDMKEEEETYANQLDVIELSNRRSKIRDNNPQTTDSWKEVSQVGRIAFQALFARGKLPQSFPLHVEPDNMNGKQSDTSIPSAPKLKIQDCCDKDKESVVMNGVGESNSVKTKQTGFRPYKRCSKEVHLGNSNNQSDENVCKRLRLEGEAST